MPNPLSEHFDTHSIHAGESETESATPIYQSATASARYMRDGNPTLDAFEEKVRTLEDCSFALSTACGMAAISQTLFAMLQPGDRVICHKVVYTWTNHLMRVLLPKFGIDVERIDMTNTANLEAALGKKTDVVYFEPLANPLLDVVDTYESIKLSHDAGAKVVIDNTYLSPYLFNPLSHGADVVIHSATKYLCGHGDALAGLVVTNDKALGQEIFTMRNTMGGILSPMNAFLLLRGIKTLSMRMDRHCVNAQAVAEYLNNHPRVLEVYYPGLTFSPGHHIAKSQWRGFGGMVTFKLDHEDVHKRFLEGVKMTKPWVSLGDAASLVSDRRENRIRMSVGLENIEDIIEDLEQAFG